MACRLRLTIPNRKGPLTVNVEVLEVLPGKRITDLSKVSGNTGELELTARHPLACVDCSMFHVWPGSAWTQHTYARPSQNGMQVATLVMHGQSSPVGILAAFRVSVDKAPVNDRVRADTISWGTCLPAAVEFYKWYADLTRAVDPLISGHGPAGASASRGNSRPSSAGAGGLQATVGSPGRRLNAFELLNCCSALNVSSIFDNSGEDTGAQHVQVRSARVTPAILSGS